MDTSFIFCLLLLPQVIPVRVNLYLGRSSGAHDESNFFPRPFAMHLQSLQKPDVLIFFPSALVWPFFDGQISPLRGSTDGIRALFWGSTIMMKWTPPNALTWLIEFV